MRLSRRPQAWICSYNVSDGSWFCHACDMGGDVFGFYARLVGQDPEKMVVDDVARRLCVELEIIDEITDQQIEEMHQSLMSSPSTLRVFMDQTRLTVETLKKFRVGFAKNRLAFPIMGESGQWEDVRLYDKNPPEGQPKIMHWKAGHGGTRVFPLSVLEANQSVVVFEGEKDCLRAQQCGIENAITFTGGAGSIPDDYGKLFRGKHADFCYDVDKVGIARARKVASIIATVGTAAIITLPPEGLPKNGDFSDWADKIGEVEALQRFQQLRAEAEPVTATRGNATAAAAANEDDTPIEVVSYAEVSGHGVYGRRVKMLSHVVGASAGLKHYQTPTDVTASCGRDRGRLCTSCSVFLTPVEDMPYRAEIDPTSEEALQLIRYSKISQNRTIKRLIGIPERCDSVVITENARSSVQVLLLSEPVELGTMREGSTGFKPAFYHGPPVVDNKDYYVTGYLHADPKTQETVFNCTDAEPARSSLDDFRCTEETIAAIEFVRPKTETLSEHFHWLLTRIEEMTGVYGRHDVSMCVLNSIYSALEFTVGNKHVENGWIDALIVGDTRTGKSEMVKRMMRIIDVGEFVSCENISLAGLLGGIQIIDGTMIPIWGKWPQNDRGFIALDEILEIAGTTGSDILGKLSTMRSSGIAEINKIQQARTKARVRSVHIANPGNRQMISSFDSGVRSINTVIRSPEDVARFTCATVVSQDTVSTEQILSDTPVTDSHVVGSHMNKLAMLTWSLKDKQIQFSIAAVTALKTAVSRLSAKYHASIPLWESGSGFVKLARLAVPIAVLCGSFVTGGEEILLLVDESHALYAVKSLEGLYDSPSMGYDRMSAQEFSRESIADPLAVVASLFTEYSTGNVDAMISYFMTSDEMTRNGLSELMGFRQHAENVWSVLLVNHALTNSRRKKDYYSKTPAFVRLLEDVQRDSDSWRDRVNDYNMTRMLNKPLDDAPIRIGV